MHHTTLAASTVNIVPKEEDKSIKPERGESKLRPCLVCSKDGDRSIATRHLMAKCEVRKKLPYNEKIHLASYVKYTFHLKQRESQNGGLSEEGLWSQLQII